MLNCFLLTSDFSSFMKTTSTSHLSNAQKRLTKKSGRMNEDAPLMASLLGTKAKNEAYCKCFKICIRVVTSKIQCAHLQIAQNGLSTNALPTHPLRVETNIRELAGTTAVIPMQGRFRFYV